MALGKQFLGTWNYKFMWQEFIQLKLFFSQGLYTTNGFAAHWPVEKLNTPDLNAKICFNKDQKIKNTVINKQRRLDFFRIWTIGYIEPNILIIMLYLHGFCYFAVNFAIFWRPEFIKRSWCHSNICIICIGALYSWSIRGF